MLLKSPSMERFVMSSTKLPLQGRATIKSVLSGDTVILRGKPTNGPPPEMTFTLSEITAPRYNAKDQEKSEVFQLYLAIWI